jgi:hypothetical protein
VNITVERCDEFFVAVPQIFDRVKSVALWSAKKKKKKETRTTKGYGSAAKGTYDNKYRYLVQGRIQGGGGARPLKLEKI